METLVHPEEVDADDERAHAFAGVAYAVLVTVACCVLLYGASSPRPGLGFGLIGTGLVILLWLSIAAVGLVALILYIAALLQRRVRPGSMHWWRWSIAPALAVATFAAVSLDVPLHARFEMSRGAFEEVVRDTRRNPDAGRFEGGWVTRRIGAYTVQNVDEVNGIVHFTVARAGIIGRIDYGFAFSPGRLPRSDGSAYTAFDGDWYLWENETPFYGTGGNVPD